MWLSPSGQVAHTTLDWRLCHTRIFSMVNNLKSVEEIIGKTDQIKQISKENEQLMNLQEGELILLSQLSQLVDETTTTLEQYKVAYAINQETGDPLDAMIYRYNGTNHTYILNENAEVTDELKADFKNFIKECYEDGSISAARSESEIVTITAEAFYTDTYIEEQELNIQEHGE